MQGEGRGADLCTAAKIEELTTVRENREIASGFWRMSLAAPRLGASFRAGQFFQFQVESRGLTPLLRRPFAPAEYDATGFAFVYAVIGEGTQRMTALEPGARASVLGPLGRGYVLPAPSGRALLVGGGCGVPSLRPLAAALARQQTEVYAAIGARTACAVLEKEELKHHAMLLALATDDGSTGHHGHAVDAAEALLDGLDGSVRPTVYGCGPWPMLRGLAALCAERDLSCQVSLEERMACGFGACMGCAVAVKADNPDGYVYKRVCADGPVFPAEAVVWDR